ncbi:hypothetical protein E1301_Tti012105 [Triplophysa tibetana]|uniref:Uncharacterized protein n=1 Tax=Triplophysa tibetana TaxID=1572043 RepID=A0A5A9PLH6_9TELE|nr:hypothetical protein E1301_Tti012105 [Triplophysa tibetana]
MVSKRVEESQATESYLVHDGPHRAPGISECFLVPESYRSEKQFLLKEQANLTLKVDSTGTAEFHGWRRCKISTVERAARQPGRCGSPQNRCGFRRPPCNPVVRERAL